MDSKEPNKQLIAQVRMSADYKSATHIYPDRLEMKTNYCELRHWLLLLLVSLFALGTSEKHILQLQNE